MRDGPVARVVLGLAPFAAMVAAWAAAGPGLAVAVCFATWAAASMILLRSR